MNKNFVFDGVKNVPLNALPEEAWTVISGSGKGNDKSKYYSFISVVFRAIKLRANAVSNIPFTIVSNSSNDVIFDSSEAMFTEQIPFAIKLKDIFYMTESSLCICSEAFYFKQMNRLNNILDLQYLQPNNINAVWDMNSGLVKFERKINNKTKDFDINDIVYTYFQNPLRETKADVSPLEAASNSAQVVLSIDNFIQQFIERGGVKVTLLQVPEDTNEFERRRLKHWWQRTINGIRSAWTAHVISNQINPVILGEGLDAISKDNGLTKERKEDIAISFGIPFSKLFSNASNFATAKQDDLAFYNETIIPEIHKIESSFNEQLFEDLGYTLKFNPQALSIYQEDEVNRADALQKLTSSGVDLSLAMQILGYNLPEGVSFDDESVIEARTEDLEESKSYTIKEEKKSNLDTSTAVESEVKAFNKWIKNKLSKNKQFDINSFSSDILSHKQKLNILNNSVSKKNFEDGDDQLRNTIENVIATGVVENFEKQKQEVLENIQDYNLETLDNVMRIFLEDSLTPVIDIAIDSNVLFFNSLLPETKRVIIASDFDLVNEAVLDWLSDYSFELIGGISDTTRDVLENEISRWIEEGESLPVLANRLSQFVFSEARARMVAETEVTRAYAEANREIWRRSGIIQEMTWRTSQDELVCQICSPLNGQVINVNSDLGFISEQIGNIAIPPAHVRCRCWIVPVISQGNIITRNEFINRLTDNG